MGLYLQPAWGHEEGIEALDRGPGEAREAYRWGPGEARELLSWAPSLRKVLCGIQVGHAKPTIFAIHY